jgi:hypothetical protein
MDTKKHISLVIIFFVLLFLMPGCLSSFGKIRSQSGNGERMTIDDLEKNWTDYTVYYAGMSPNRSSGVMFDPKNDDKTLLPGSNDRWKKIEDKYRVLGPDDQFYGYLFSGRSDVTIEVFDDRTMFVNDFPDSLSDGAR